MAADAESQIGAGFEAMAAGLWSQARDVFTAVLEVAEVPEALLGLANACYWLGDLAGVMDSFERAYAASRRRRDPVLAAAAALSLVGYHKASAPFSLRGGLKSAGVVEAPVVGWVPAPRASVRQASRSPVVLTRNVWRVPRRSGNRAPTRRVVPLAAGDRGRRHSRMSANRTRAAHVCRTESQWRVRERQRKQLATHRRALVSLPDLASPSVRVTSHRCRARPHPTARCTSPSRHRTGAIHRFQPTAKREGGGV
jgi:hypothetical protein